jgi:hypothetical protein
LKRGSMPRFKEAVSRQQMLAAFFLNGIFGGEG